jgi:hypothetical protein
MGKSTDPRALLEDPDLALRMWLEHNRILCFARAYPEDTLAVSMDMIRDGFPILRALEDRWNLGLEDVPLGEVYDPRIAARRTMRQPVSNPAVAERPSRCGRAGGSGSGDPGDADEGGAGACLRRLLRPDGPRRAPDGERASRLRGELPEEPAGLDGEERRRVRSLSRLAHLEEAERDLVLLVGASPGAPWARSCARAGNFRTLEGRYPPLPRVPRPDSPNRVAYLEGAEKDLVLLLRRLGRGPLGRYSGPGATSAPWNNGTSRRCAGPPRERRR